MFSFRNTRGNATMRYPQGLQTVMACQAGDRDPCPRTPLRTRFSLDGGRSQELSRFYQVRTRGTMEGNQGGHSVPLAARGCGEMTPPVPPAHGEARCPKSMCRQEAGMPPQQPNLIPGSSCVWVLTKLKQASAGGGLIPGITRVCVFMGECAMCIYQAAGAAAPRCCVGSSPPIAAASSAPSRTPVSTGWHARGQGTG